jgi:hypothetical protein
LSPNIALSVMSPCGLVDFTTFSQTKLITGNTERVSNLTIQPDDDTYAGTQDYVMRQKSNIVTRNK